MPPALGEALRWSGQVIDGQLREFYILNGKD